VNKATLERHPRPACPHCGTDIPGGWHTWAEGRCWCGCAMGHRHEGVLSPKVCGRGVVSWVTRLLRMCRLDQEHLHYKCTACGGRWTEPRNGTVK
jgi:hypothetical protein